MKPLLKYCFVLILLWGISGMSVLLGQEEVVVLKGTEVELKTEELRGQLQWQVSSNLIVWENIIGQNQPNYKFSVLDEAYYRIGVKDGACEWVYSSWVKYIPISQPRVTFYWLVPIAYDSVRFAAAVNPDHYGTITRRGFVWGLSENPDTSSNVMELDPVNGTFAGSTGSLEPNNTYYFRAFAQNEAGLAYSDQKQITIFPGEVLLKTLDPDTVTQTHALLRGKFEDLAGNTIESMGFCWGLDENPDLSDSSIELNPVTDEFFYQIENLNPSTSYNYRAYARAETGLYYGENISFITRAFLPQVSQCTPVNIQLFSASLSFSVLSDGQGTITDMGCCYSLESNPDLTDYVARPEQLASSATIQLQNLQHNTSYYVRAFATNEEGTSYGQEFHFSTLEGKLSVVTNAAGKITDKSAWASGLVTENTFGQLSEVGFCFSEQPNPDLSSQTFIAGSNANSFSAELSQLKSNTTYYLKSYAKNDYSTVLGNEVIFTTRDSLFFLFEPTLNADTRAGFKGWTSLFPDYGSNGNGYSGVTYNWDTEELYIVGNNARAIWVVKSPNRSDWNDASPGSAYRRIISLSGYQDPEAITYLGNGWIMIGDEALRQVSFTKITDQTTNINRSSADVILETTRLFGTSVSLNSSRQMEGIAYDFHNKILYGLCEIGSNDHPRLFAWDWDFENQKIDPDSGREVTSFFPGIRDNWDQGSDLHFSPLLNRLYIVSGADDIMAEYYCPHPDASNYGKFIGSVQLPRSNGASGSQLGDCEGICTTKDGSHLILVFETKGFAYAPLPIIRQKENDNLDPALYPFK
jgi:uncharacterized protein YjiK